MTQAGKADDPGDANGEKGQGSGFGDGDEVKGFIQAGSEDGGGAGEGDTRNNGERPVFLDFFGNAHNEPPKNQRITVVQAGKTISRPVADDMRRVTNTICGVGNGIDIFRLLNSPKLLLIYVDRKRNHRQIPVSGLMPALNCCRHQRSPATQASQS